MLRVDRPRARHVDLGADLHSRPFHSSPPRGLIPRGNAVEQECHVIRRIPLAFVALCLLGCRDVDTQSVSFRHNEPSFPAAVSPALTAPLAWRLALDANARTAWWTAIATRPREVPVVPSKPSVPQKRATVPNHTAVTTGGEVPQAPSGDVWAALARCESGMTNASTGNGFYGYFQFTAQTWRGIGESGLPTDYGYETQRAAAQRLQARSGWGQWPVCSQKIGVR